MEKDGRKEGKNLRFRANEAKRPGVNWEKMGPGREAEERYFYFEEADGLGGE